MLDPLECVHDVWCVPEFCVVSCAPFCRALFWGDFHCFSVAFAAGLVRGGRMAVSSVVCVGVFWWVSWRDNGGFLVVVLRR